MKKCAMTRIPFSVPLFPLAMEFADKDARDFGYSDLETGGPVLAVEEMFSFYVLDRGWVRKAMERVHRGEGE